MLGPEEKSFFIRTAMGARGLSGAINKQGAVLVKEKQILSYGFNRKILKDKEWEISAIYDVIFGARSENLEDTILFSTYLPNVDDLKLIVAVGCTSIYFVGEITSPESVKFLNDITEGSIPLEIVQLEDK